MKQVYFAVVIYLVCYSGMYARGQQGAARGRGQIKITGAMKDVMWKGELSGKIALDTIGNKDHLYGFGPVENLAGEILVADGHSFVATVVSPSTMNVRETFQLKAPFFAYTNIADWREQALPDSVTNLERLERYLLRQSSGLGEPFMFKLEGLVGKSKIHIVNLPKGTKVSSPEDARKGTVRYPVNNAEASVIGFFSTRHKTIFTHHDTYLHMHLLTKDHKKMGHVDEISFDPRRMKLFLPL